MEGDHGLGIGGLDRELVKRPLLLLDVVVEARDLLCDALHDLHGRIALHLVLLPAAVHLAVMQQRLAHRAHPLRILFRGGGDPARDPVRRCPAGGEPEYGRDQGQAARDAARGHRRAVQRPLQGERRVPGSLGGVHQLAGEGLVPAQILERLFLLLLQSPQFQVHAGDQAALAPDLEVLGDVMDLPRLHLFQHELVAAVEPARHQIAEIHQVPDRLARLGVGGVEAVGQGALKRRRGLRRRNP